MRDREPQGNDLLIYAGVGIYGLAVALQMLSFWSNAYVWSWMTLKYLALLFVAALPIVMFEGRARMARVLGLFFAVLAISGSVSYSEGSIDYHASSKRRAVEEKLERAKQDWDAKHSGEYRDYQYYDNLARNFDNESTALREQMDPNEVNAKAADLKTKRDKAEKDYRAELKDYRTADAIENVSELEHELQFDHTELQIAERRDDLRAAKLLDFFILLGVALFVAGSLMPGEGTIPPYTPPIAKDTAPHP